MRFVALLLIAIAGACAQAVDVAPVQKRDRPIVIKHESGETVNAIYGRVQAGKVVWEFLPDDHFHRGDTQTVMAGPIGEYIITTGDSAIVKVIEDGRPHPEPIPDPEPSPEPDPPDPKPDPPGPNPIKASWVIWVEEQEHRGQFPSETKVMLDLDKRAELNDRGLKVRIFDEDQPLGKPFASAAGDVRPAMILLEDDKNFRVFKAPRTVEELEKIIRGNVIR